VYNILKVKLKGLIGEQGAMELRATELLSIHNIFPSNVILTRKYIYFQSVLGRYIRFYEHFAEFLKFLRTSHFFCKKR